MIGMSRLGKLLLVSAFVVALTSVTASLVNGESVFAIQKETGTEATPWFQLDAANKQALINQKAHELLVNGSPSITQGTNNQAVIEFKQNGDSYEIPDTVNLFEESDFVVSLNVKPNPGSPENYPQFFIDHFNWSLYMPNPQQITFRAGRMNDGKGEMYAVNAKFDEPLSEWTHVLALYNPQAQQIAIYINGEQVNVTDIGDNIIYRNYGKQNLQIGASQHNLNKFTFMGEMQDVRIFDGPLAKKEIQKLADPGGIFLPTSLLITGGVVGIILIACVSFLISKKNRKRHAKA